MQAIRELPPTQPPGAQNAGVAPTGRRARTTHRVLGPVTMDKHGHPLPRALVHSRPSSPKYTTDTTSSHDPCIPAVAEVAWPLARQAGKERPDGAPGLLRDSAT